MKNMGSADRIIRAVLGLILIVTGIMLQIQTGQLWWLALPGVIFVLTSVLSFCPLYIPLKIDTGKGRRS